jgi:ABA DEFICIENT 4-like
VTPSDTLFQFITLLPLPFWFLMVVLPNWRGTRRVMRGRLAVVPLLAAYAVLVVPQLPTLLSIFFRSGPLDLEQLARLLGQPEIALIAWTHFLAFDLFVGRWIYRDSQERGVGAWPMAAVLLLTLLLGPLGLLLYLLLRTQFRLGRAN